jgi:hypothetical protein
METCVYLRIPAALPSRKKAGTHGIVGSLRLQPAWTFWREKNRLRLPGFEPQTFHSVADLRSLFHNFQYLLPGIREYLFFEPERKPKDAEIGFYPLFYKNKDAAFMVNCLFIGQPKICFELYN